MPETAKTVNLKEYASRLDANYLHKLVAKLDSFPENNTSSQPESAYEIFREGVMALDALDYSSVTEKPSWVQNLENGLALASKKVFNLEIMSLSEDRESTQELQQTLEKDKKCLTQLDEMYEDNEPTLYINTETGDYTSMAEWEEDETEKILAYDINKFRFKDAKNKYFAFMETGSHVLIKDPDIASKHAHKDPGVMKSHDSVPLAGTGVAKDFKLFFEKRIKENGTLIYSRVLSSLEQKKLGGFVRQFYPQEMLTKADSEPQILS